MKRIISSLFFVFVMSGAFAQLSTDQFTVVTKVSADWCPNCGGWAWPVFDDMRSQLGDKNTIFVLAHRDGGLRNDVSLAWCTNLKYQYQPEFYLNNDSQSMNSNSAPAAIASMGEQIDLLESFGAFAGVEGQGVVNSSGDKLSANVDVEFFSEIDGDYYLGVYTIQNNIIANQSGQGMVQQPKLLTGAFTDEWYGVPVSSTTGIQSFEFEMDLPEDFSSEEGDTEILSVVWNRLEDGTYLFFNAHVNGSIETLSSTSDLEGIVSSLKANFAADQLNVKLQAEEALQNAKLSLSNVSGQNIISNKEVNAQIGLNEFSIATNNLNRGIYILTLQIGDKKISQKIFK